MTPIPASPITSAGSTNSQECAINAAINTSKSISVKPIANTTMFFPHRICLGSTGKKQRGQSLALEAQHVIGERIEREQHNAGYDHDNPGSQERKTPPA